MYRVYLQSVPKQLQQAGIVAINPQISFVGSMACKSMDGFKERMRNAFCHSSLLGAVQN